jgi:hypothetical protein
MKHSTKIESNMWIRQIELEYVGDEYGGHCHTFDHQHILAIGSVDIMVENVGSTTYTAPTVITIPKGLIHSMVANTEKTLGFCLHPIRDGKGLDDIVDSDDLPENFDLDRWKRNRDYPGLLDENR